MKVTTQDAVTGTWSDVGTYELKFHANRRAWEELKFVIPETTTTKLRFLYKNDRIQWVLAGRINFYMHKDDVEDAK